MWYAQYPLVRYSPHSLCGTRYSRWSATAHITYVVHATAVGSLQPTWWHALQPLVRYSPRGGTRYSRWSTTAHVVVSATAAGPLQPMW